MSDLAPTYLSDLLNQKTRNPWLRQLYGGLQPAVQPASKSIGRRGFRTTGPVHWNALPLSLRDAPSLALLKRKLKTHLFQCAYGYVWKILFFMDYNDWRGGIYMLLCDGILIN